MLLETAFCDKCSWNSSVAMHLYRCGQSGKYFAALGGCEWYIPAKGRHYIIHEWSVTQKTGKCVMLASRKQRRSSLTPTLLNKNLYNAVYKNGEGFSHLKNKFKRTSEAEMNEHDIVCP
jgi:hypothetical protein